MSHVLAPHNTTYQVRRTASLRQVELMERILTRNEFYTGDYDRLWKMLEAHRINLHDRTDGIPFPFDTAQKTIAWLFRREVEARQSRIAQQPTRQPAHRVDFNTIPVGGYAINSLTGNNDTDFFWVTRPDTGKWAGFTFVERVIGGHDNVPVKGVTKRQALEGIAAAGILAAGQRYGQELRECGRCRTHLTKDISRERGYGPDCWAHVQAGE